MSRSLRVAFLGNDRWSVPSLQAIAGSGHEVVAVITAERRPAGRGNRLRPTPVARAAAAAGLPRHEVQTIRSGPGADALTTSAPDLLIVVAYGEILPKAVLDLPAIAPVNLHFSLLPELRGASPVQTALLEGREETGVTTIVMDTGVDTGPIIARRAEAIGPEDDAGSLGDRLAAIGAEVLVETADLFADGAADPRAQDEAAATFTRRLGADDRVLRWIEPARDLVNRTRAMSPEPGATTRFRGEDLKIFRADAVPASGAPGSIVESSKQGFVVATGEDGYRALELAPAGRRRMSSSDFVNGYRPVIGESLG
ncbi:MAG TPA: methionyl-tRNA formyltransferase [Actinomycetota bacterium]|nr:methionyl-tRNA formyltransferase [Actinomycetota bacterium]